MRGLYDRARESKCVDYDGACESNAWPMTEVRPNASPTTFGQGG